MKKLMLLSTLAAFGCAFAAEPAKSEAPATDAAKAAPAKETAETAPLEKEDSLASLFWGFGNYGLYSGYQLYGSLVNPEPTMQGYGEVNMNLLFDEWDLGYLGVGIWSNTDLTDRRRDSYGKAFNEWDYNIHWGRTFWFDDEKKYGLDYRCGFVWYYYPHRRHDGLGASTATTVDFDHWFTFKNPFVDLFFNYIREYHENNANLFEFGARRTCAVTEKFSLTPSVTFVVRSHRYNWCFPTAGFSEFHNGGMATGKIQLDANYQLTDNFGLFAKVAYCSIMDKDLRDAADNGSGADYGKYKDFAWGGVGMTFNF